MLKWTIIFFAVAVITGFLGFFNLAGPFSGIMQLLFVVFSVACMIALIAHLFGNRKQSSK